MEHPFLESIKYLQEFYDVGDLAFPNTHVPEVIEALFLTIVHSSILLDSFNFLRSHREKRIVN